MSIEALKNARRDKTIMKRIAAGLAIIGSLASCLAPMSASAAPGDPAPVWPKDSYFTCRGVLSQDEGTHRLAPDQGMLPWCAADIGDRDERRVLKACKLGNACEIKGTIRGRGTFAWAAIASVNPVPSPHR